MSDIVRRILVPVDFSVHSQHVTRYACELAARLGARVELLHVVDDPFLARALGPELYPGGSAETAEQLVADASTKLREAAIAARRHGAPVQFVVLRGNPARMIVKQASACDCDVIVMGTHARTGVAHLILGSVAERVRRSAACPVLTLNSVAGQHPDVHDLELASVTV